MLADLLSRGKKGNWSFNTNAGLAECSVKCHDQPVALLPMPQGKGQDWKNRLETFSEVEGVMHIWTSSEFVWRDIAHCTTSSGIWLQPAMKGSHME